MNLTRRRFLEISGLTAAGSVAGVAALATIKRELDSLKEAAPEEWRNRTEQRVNSICQLCPGGCGLSVRVVGGVPVKIEGNPLYPVNHGALCPRGLAGLQSLYDPDRLVSPLRQVGGKGSGKWQPVSWEEALSTVTGALTGLRKRGAPEALTILGGEYRGAIDRLWDRFAKSYGTPNYLRLRTRKPEAPDPIAVLMHGETRPLGYDLGNASFVLSFGCNWLESWNSPVHQMQAFSNLRQGRGRRRAEIVHVEPRLSHSAAKADRWISLKPGTEGILALGMAHLILREQIYDEEFIRKQTFGFEDWRNADGVTHAGFKRVVLDKYAPLRVSKITGVGLETIVTVARKFASARAKNGAGGTALALGDNRSQLEGHDLFTRMAIHSLNALVGAIGANGGVLPGRDAPPVSPWPALTLDDAAKRGLARGRLDGAGAAERFLDADVPRDLPAAILGAKSSPVEVLILHRANPLHGRPDRDAFAKALKKIPLVVSISGVPDEASLSADLILPEHHFLESWLDDPVTFLPGFSLFGIGRPALEPLYDTRHPGDIVLNLARGVGGAVAEAFPWESHEATLQSSAQGLFEANRGFVISAPTDELFRRVLQRQGYVAPEFDDFEAFWAALVERGAWWDPAEPVESARRWFSTPSAKFEFYPQLLEAQLRQAAAAGAETASLEERRRILAALGAASAKADSVAGEELFFPRAMLSRLSEGSAEPATDFPFVLQTYELLSIGGGIGANLPWLQENLTAQVDGHWESWVEIHPDAAREQGISDGDLVWVESPAGKLSVRARFYPGLAPGVVALPQGQGRTAGGHWAKDRGVDPSRLLAGGADPGEGLGLRKQTRVRIRPA